MLTHFPNSPNFDVRGWDQSISALRAQNRQTFHRNGMRVDPPSKGFPKGRPTKVDEFGAKLSSPHRGVAKVANLAPKVEPKTVVVVVTPKPALVKVEPKPVVVVRIDPNPTMAPTVEAPKGPIPLANERFGAQEQERRARLKVLKVEQLKALAKDAAIAGRSKMRKAGLINALMTQTLKG